MAPIDETLSAGQTGAIDWFEQVARWLNGTDVPESAFAQQIADTAGLAPLASPALTGTPTAPTAAAGTDTTQVATTEFVKDAVDNATSDVAVLQQTQSAVQSEHDFDSDAAWCWFNGPLVVDYEGTHSKRYAGWVKDGGDIVIGSWDLTTGDKELFTLHAALDDDDHAAPGILVRTDGRILVFYSGHGGPGYYRLSTNPEDISAFDAEVAMGVGSITYPKPAQIGSRIYVFYRGGDETLTNEHLFIYSDDQGTTWSDPQKLWHDASVAAAPGYISMIEKDDRIDFLASNSHPSHASGSDNRLYHFYFDGTTFRTSDGTAIYTIDTLPAAGLALSDTTQVYDGVTNGKGWGWDIARDSDDNPVVVFASFPSDTDHRYNYGRWTGAAWETSEITPAGGKLGTSEVVGFVEANYSGGIAVVQDDPSVVYLSRQVDPGGQFEIERWVTSDGGSSWASSPVTVESSEPQSRPMTPRSPVPGSLPVLWQAGVYRDYTDFDTRIVTSAEPVASALHRAVLTRPKAAPTFIGAETVATDGTSSTSVMLDKPAGTKRGDLLLAFVNVNGTATIITAPAGWTLGATSNSFTSRRAWYWATATSEDAEAFTFTFDGTHPHSASVQTWRGVDTASPVNATGLGESSTALPVIHPQAGRSRLVFLMGGSAYSSGVVSVVPDSRLTERFDVSSIASNRWLGNASADVIVDRVGRIDDYTAAMTNVQAGANFAVALTPGGGTADAAEHDPQVLDAVFLTADSWIVGTGVGTSPGKQHFGNRWVVWLMDAAGSERVAQNFEIPAGWNTAHADLLWTNAGAGAGDIVAQVFVTPYVDGDATTKGVTIRGPATLTAPAQGVLKTDRIASDIPVTGGAFHGLMLDRIGGHAADTLANDAGFVALRLTKAS